MSLMSIIKKLFKMRKENNSDDLGEAGEKFVQSFFDSQITDVLSFPNPKTKHNDEVCDLLIWMNRTVILVEIKTKTKSKLGADAWAGERLKKSVEQIIKAHKRITSKEQIFIRNKYYQTTLDCEGVAEIFGIVILVLDEAIEILPSSFVIDIYKHELPIQLFTMNEILEITSEIDTIPDFIYYLKDRYGLVKKTDIAPKSELNLLGLYKLNNNKFPEVEIKIDKINLWEEYKAKRAEDIKRREIHNQYSIFVDHIEDAFKNQRRLFDGIPLGLYFAWELGSLSRRFRASIGEKISSFERWFLEGNAHRKLGIYNTGTENWLVFYFSRSQTREVNQELHELIKLKAIKEIHLDNFQYGIYGFGLRVSSENPPDIEELAGAIVLDVNEYRDKYSKDELKNALSIWGDQSSKYEVSIEEFPE